VVVGYRVMGGYSAVKNQGRTGEELYCTDVP